jgi:hypothetical protein
MQRGELRGKNISCEKFRGQFFILSSILAVNFGPQGDFDSYGRTFIPRVTLTTRKEL